MLIGAFTFPLSVASDFFLHISMTRNDKCFSVFYFISEKITHQGLHVNLQLIARSIKHFIASHALISSDNKPQDYLPLWHFFRIHTNYKLSLHPPAYIIIRNTERDFRGDNLLPTAVVCHRTRRVRCSLYIPLLGGTIGVAMQ